VLLIGTIINGRIAMIIAKGQLLHNQFICKRYEY